MRSVHGANQGICVLHSWGAPPGQDEWPCPFCLSDQIERLEAEAARLQQELADMTADYHRWHDAYLELKYPGMGPRIATVPNSGVSHG